MRYYMIALVGMLSLLSACHTPYAVIRQQPTQSDAVWYQGKAFVSEENEQVQLVVAFEQQWDRNLIYELEIKNIGPDPLIVSPEHMYSMMSPGPDIISNELIHAVNPEEQLLALDAALSRERAYIANNRTASLIGTVANTVGAVTADTPEEAQFYENEQIDQNAWDANEEAAFQTNSTNLNDQKSLWQYDMLRRTTLQPGESIQGRIAIPSRKVSAYSILHFPYGETPIKIPFSQTIHQP